MIRNGPDALRPLVKSKTRDVWHQIDLAAYRGNGSCECEDFEFHRKPLLQAGGLAQDSNRCQHIILARADLLNEVIERLAETLPKHEPAA